MTDAPDDLDPLEAELRSFRPVPPSQATFDRVGRQLAAPARSMRVRPWLAAVMAAAACFIIAAVAWRVTHPPHKAPVPMAHPVPATTPTDQPDRPDRPDLAAYRRALSRSSGDLEDLLDRHAATVLSGGAGGPGPLPRLTASALSEL